MKKLLLGLLLSVLLVSPVSADGIDSFTKFCSHFDGTNGQTSATDSATALPDAPHAITFVSGAQLSTAQKEFGTSSLLLNGTTDYDTCTDSNDWAFATPFTIDFWIRFTSVAVNQGILDQYQSGAAYWNMRWATGINNLYWVMTGGGGGTLQMYCTFAFSADTWYHIALVRVNNDNAATGWRFFVNGVSQTLNLDAGAWNSATGNNTGLLQIGRAQESGMFLAGYMDELRISNGVARWTTDFTPPTAPYSIPTKPKNITMLVD